MAALPQSNALRIHFAHVAYQLKARFDARATGIECFQTWTPEETAARIGEGDVFVASGFWRNHLLPKADNLKFIQVCAAGYDNYDHAAIAERGVRLCNASGVNANAVSDHALALMLGFTRQTHLARDNQKRKVWRGMISDIPKREDELAGKTVLIYGAGKIGGRIARLSKAFEMTTLGVRRDVSKTVPAMDKLYAPGDFMGVLPLADFVILACPLTDATRNLMDAAAFKAMKPSARLINVARGGCVNQDALIDALNAGEIAGAGIDVTVPEPLDAASPLWGFENVILTPHTGGETQRYEDNVVDFLLENIQRLQAGRTDLLNQIV